MSIGSQFRTLNRQAAAFRQELVGTDSNGDPVKFSYDRGQRENIEGYYQFVKRRYWTQEAGAREQQGAILRIRKDQPALNSQPLTLNPFEFQKQISFKDATGRELTFIIEDFLGAHHASVEWVLGCRLA
jgi:hypothetical protein